MDSLSTAAASAAPALRDRDRHSRTLQVESHAHLPRLDRLAAGATTSSRRRSPPTPRCRARSRQAPDRLLAAMKLSDDIGQLSYKVWYFASLKYDEDQRDNEINARRQQVQILFAKASQASAWFNPELLDDPAAHRPAVDDGQRRARGLSLRARGSLPPAGARARREGRAPAVARRAASRRRRTTPTPRCRPPTSSTRRSRCRRAPRSR